MYIKYLLRQMNIMLSVPGGILLFYYPDHFVKYNEAK